MEKKHPLESSCAQHPALTITALLGEKRMEALLHKIAGATDLAVALADYRGDECAHINCCNFCRSMRAGKGPVCTAASAANAFGIAQACVTEKPFIYFCPYGLMLMAVPIIVHGQYLGGFIAGQVRCSDAPADTVHLKNILPHDRNFLHHPGIRREFDAIPVLPYQKFLDTAHLISLIIYQLSEQGGPLREADAAPQLRDAEAVLQETRVSALLTLIYQRQYGLLMQTIPDLVYQTMQQYQTRPADLRTLFVQLAQPLAPGEEIRPFSGTDFPAQLYEQAALSGQADYWIFYLTQAADQALRAHFLHRHGDFAPVFAMIDERVQTELSLGALCRSCRFSQSYLSRLFRSYFHVSVMDYIHWRKIACAKLYLAFTDLSVTQVGYHMGYTDGSYFSKVFKKYTGISPSQYKRPDGTGTAARKM